VIKIVNALKISYNPALYKHMELVMIDTKAAAIQPDTKAGV